MASFTRRFQPSVEPLEDRQMLAASLFTVPVPQGRTAAVVQRKKVNATSQVVKLTNQFRQANGLAPLQINPLLTAAALNHAAALAAIDRPGDNGNAHVLNGQSTTDRVVAVGYSFSYLGENIAWGAFPRKTLAQALLRAWQNSPPHRANLLQANFTEIGVGIAFSRNGDVWAVQVFARPL